MSDDECNVLRCEKSSKKRKTFGRISEVNKKIKVQSHEMGENCYCKRYKCFDVVNLDQRNKILRDFNLMKTRDDQNLYLCGLITVYEVQRRRPRKAEDDANLHSATYVYRVRITDNTQTKDVPVCFKAFMAMHGISQQRLKTLKKSLQETGNAPLDMRGKHNNRPRKLTEDVKNKVMEHIRSFRGRKSHYSLHESSKIYLPEELNVKKMYDLFQYKDLLSYESYRSIFVNNFNIGFGYPRSDTCGKCDEFKAKLKGLEVDLKSVSNSEEKDIIEKKIKDLESENKVHKIKAETFYRKKRESRIHSQSSLKREAIAMDYQKNLSMPNITSNETYYKRQLTFNSFNIHALASSDSYFYCYDETIAKKGADEVCSFLHHYIFTKLNANVRELVIFCDSCGGQNKNYCMFRFIHYVVHTTKRLDVIKMVFPIRGHSYLECDKNMALINQKAPCETPDDWRKVVAESRLKPTPFRVIDVDQPLVRSWTRFLAPKYKKTCPFLSRPIREIRVEITHPRLIFYRDSYNGHWTSSVMLVAKRRRVNSSSCEDIPNSGEFILPDQAYKDILPISKAKFLDIQSLSKYCGPTAKKFFSNLKYNN